MAQAVWRPTSGCNATLRSAPAASATAVAPRRPRALAPRRRAPPLRASDTDAPSTSAAAGGGPTYQGVYGPWRVTKEDELEVLW